MHAETLHVLDVGARDEGPVTGSRKDDDANFRVARELLQHSAKLLRMLDIDRVQGVRPVDGDDGDAAAVLDVYGHDLSLDGNVFLEEVDDLGHRRSRSEDLGDALLLERRDVVFRDRSADHDEDVLHPVVA
jgi:hypothetical protein